MGNKRSLEIWISSIMFLGMIIQIFKLIEILHLPHILSHLIILYQAFWFCFLLITRMGVVICSNISMSRNVNTNQQKTNKLSTDIRGGRCKDALSLKTQMFRKFISHTLTKRGMCILIKTIDNGDSFFDAYAKGLELLQIYNENGNVFSVKELRMKCAYMADKLHQRNDSWLEHVTRGELERGEIYSIGIRFTAEERMEMGFSDVIWGRPHIEGIMLGEIFDLNLNVISIELNTEEQCSDKYLQDPNNYLICDNLYPNPPYPGKRTLLMANYPSHFMAVLPKS